MRARGGTKCDNRERRSRKIIPLLNVPFGNQSNGVPGPGRLVPRYETKSAVCQTAALKTDQEDSCNQRRGPVWSHEKLYSNSIRNPSLSARYVPEP
jgi:hypothetical protein